MVAGRSAVAAAVAVAVVGACDYYDYACFFFLVGFFFFLVETKFIYLLFGSINKKAACLKFE